MPMTFWPCLAHSRATSLSRTAGEAEEKPVVKCAIVMRAPLFFFQAEDGIRDLTVTGVQTCALPIYEGGREQQNHPLDHGVVTLEDRVEQEPPDAGQREDVLDDDDAAHDVAELGAEIGRASCRERV